MGCPIEGAMEGAAAGGHIELLSWLFQNGKNKQKKSMMALIFFV